ncbi:DUF5689 domain-containing protein [Sphingobacterium sp. BIGb0165]|uniref:DUF5689 domain-containing protein n=1 Tax=Sphingobacterium sp. BIGb0165 TaxID=2940615 RepID=UPI00216A4F4A|nr:DUF5689 domain-containing protein [Sphingobacterium sp. BIGb0165]MCS4226969.1 hypothetical protein [Sphingobacterium sp. BIGb0165]
MKSKFVSSIVLSMFLILGLSACKKENKGNPEPQPIEVKTITVTELRTLSTATSIKIPDGRKIKGIVVSDVSAKNIDNKTVVLQEGTGKPGVIVTFDATQTFALGDEIELTISNQTLAQVNGEVILQNIPSANAKKIAAGSITPKATTIADIKTNKVDWDGTLVSVNATELSSTDGKYKGTLRVKDASGDLTSIVITGAVFENNTLPVSVSKLTGIVRINGNDVRIDVRNVNDVITGDVTRIENVLIPDQIRYVGGNAYSTRGTIPIAADANFTEATKFYSYLLRTNTTAAFSKADQAGILTFTDAVKSEAKTITITFAGSALKGAVDGGYFGDYVPNFTLEDFNPANHTLKIGVGMGTSDDAMYGQPLIGESPTYSEVGKFYSLTIKFPTKADLISKGVPAAMVDEFLANPQIAIYNLSSKRSTVSSSEYSFAPLLVSKVEVGY